MEILALLRPPISSTLIIKGSSDAEKKFTIQLLEWNPMYLHHRTGIVRQSVYRNSKKSYKEARVQSLNDRKGSVERKKPSGWRETTTSRRKRVGCFTNGFWFQMVSLWPMIGWHSRQSDTLKSNNPSSHICMQKVDASPRHAVHHTIQMKFENATLRPPPSRNKVKLIDDAPWMQAERQKKK